MPREAMLVMTQMPDPASARALARTLIEARLAACVSVGGATQSLYHWRGEIETAQETPVWIKTCVDVYDRVEAAIRSQHPYELPEIVAVPISHGLPAYLDWIAAETQPQIRPA